MIASHVKSCKLFNNKTQNTLMLHSSDKASIERAQIRKCVSGKRKNGIFLFIMLQMWFQTIVTKVGSRETAWNSCLSPVSVEVDIQTLWGNGDLLKEIVSLLVNQMLVWPKINMRVHLNMVYLTETISWEHPSVTILSVSQMIFTWCEK